MDGYFILQRNVMEELREAGPITKLVYIECLERARFSATADTPRGSFTSSRERLALEIGISEQQLRTALLKLKHLSLINQPNNQPITNRSTNISICNYDSIAKVPTNQITNQEPTKEPGKKLKAVRSIPLTPRVGDLATQDHNGQHKNCRACGTNLRTRAKNFLDQQRKEQNDMVLKVLRESEKSDQLLTWEDIQAAKEAEKLLSQKGDRYGGERERESVGA